VQSLRFAGELDGDDVLLMARSASDTGSAALQASIPTNPGTSVATDGELETYFLTLDATRKRRVIIQAPPAVSGAELKRIQEWLSYQLLVQESGPAVHD
jgi:hypothetical protein